MTIDPKAPRASLRRRDVLRALGVGAGAAATASVALVAQTSGRNAIADEKRKARYRADSPEVQTYYRVNRYPKN
jgi:hypothetical protein